MKSEKNPWFKFYAADWRACPELRQCSAAARGVWIELMCLMHSADPYGHLLIGGKKPSIGQLSTSIGLHHRTVYAAIAELIKHNVCGMTDAGFIYSRKMVRDYEKQQLGKINGARGGNPKLLKGLTPPLTHGDNTQKLEAICQKQEASKDAAAISKGKSDPSSNATILIATYDESLREIYGPEAARPWPGATDTTIAGRWIEAGADPELCRGVFDAVLARRKASGDSAPHSLKYFDGAVREALGARTRGPRVSVQPPADAEENRWRMRLRGFRERGAWLPDYGPRPGEPGCMCPPHILKEWQAAA